MTVAAGPPTYAVGDTWLAYAEMAALQALEIANRRLLREHGRAVRHRSNNLRSTDPTQWHERLPTSGVDLDRLLDGVLRLFDRTAPRVDPIIAACTRQVVTTYLRAVLTERMRHNGDELARMIHQAGCLHRG